MIKAVMIAGVVAACGFLGTIKAGELKERIILLEDFRRMLIYLKGKINYFREPLTTMADTDEINGRSKAFKLLIEAGTALSEKNDEMGQIWGQEADRIYKGTPLTKSDMEIIKYPGSFLGQTDWQNQQASFDYLEQHLGEQLAEASHAYATRGPLYRKIGFLAGGLAAIIFI